VAFVAPFRSKMRCVFQPKDFITLDSVVLPASERCIRVLSGALQFQCRVAICRQNKYRGKWSQNELPPSSVFPSRLFRCCLKLPIQSFAVAVHRVAQKWKHTVHDILFTYFAVLPLKNKFQNKSRGYSFWLTSAVEDVHINFGFLVFYFSS